MMTQRPTCEHCGAVLTAMPVAPFGFCASCHAWLLTYGRELHAQRLPIVAWATRVVEDRADIYGDNDKDWLHV